MIRTIFCDLDQVIVNFLGGAKKALGREFNDPALGTDEDKWRIIRAIPDFWLTLEWMPNAVVLWERVRWLNTFVLTACPTLDENPLCAKQKVQWCSRMA